MSNRPAEKFIGKPCKAGHNGERYLKGGRCCQCMVAAERTRKRGVTPKPAEVRRAEARIAHMAWLANRQIAPVVSEYQTDAGRRIDPASMEGRAIIAEMGLRYPDITVPSSLAG